MSLWAREGIGTACRQKRGAKADLREPFCADPPRAFAGSQRILARHGKRVDLEAGFADSRHEVLTGNLFRVETCVCDSLHTNLTPKESWTYLFTIALGLLVVAMIWVACDLGGHSLPEKCMSQVLRRRPLWYRYRCHGDYCTSHYLIGVAQPGLFGHDGAHWRESVIPLLSEVDSGGSKRHVLRHVAESIDETSFGSVLTCSRAVEVTGCDSRNTEASKMSSQSTLLGTDESRYGVSTHSGPFSDEATELATNPDWTISGQKDWFAALGTLIALCAVDLLPKGAWVSLVESSHGCDGCVSRLTRDG